ncbi:MAG: S8/S53 family peptidase [Bacteroidota bacterium]
MRSFFLLMAILTTSLLFSQERKAQHIPGQVLVQMQEGVDAEEWVSKQSRQSTAELELHYLKRLSERANIHLLGFAEGMNHRTVLHEMLGLDPAVQSFQDNATVEFRGRPNDDQYFRQWDMEKIDAPSAWAATTGGTTASGKPIVVAIMDSGFDTAHVDLVENIWNNPHEIPNDGIDNDNNGYVDDMKGWDYFSDSPRIAPGSHGISTTAIVGAKGNNGEGVTGVNWDADLMLFSFRDVADLVMAYEYVIDQRDRFNRSEGAEGAFVVATNNSFGQTGIRCEQQAIWGAMYDQLGAVGILSSSGVSNQRFDVEEFGDMPADCTSDYLLISCNTDEDDNLEDDSAFGKISVDIGSPGEGSITAKPGNTYGAFGGNSAATPHVTGAIALLYASNCENLEASAITDPAGTALLIKDILLQSGDLLVSIEFRTLTGRRLNLGKAMEDILTSCQNTLGPLSIFNVYPNPVQDELTIEYASPENGTYRAELYNALGQLVRHQEIIVGEVGFRRFTIDASNLPAGTYFLRFGRDDAWAEEKVVVY